MSIITKLNNSNIQFDKIKFFREYTALGYINMPDNNITINKLVNSSLDLYINSINLINTDTLISNEGQKLTGKAIVIDFDIILSIKYTQKDNFNVLYKNLNVTGNSTYIVVPKIISEIEIERIINNKFYSLYSFLENEDVLLKDDKNIEFTITSLFIFNPLSNLLTNE